MVSFSELFLTVIQEITLYTTAVEEHSMFHHIFYNICNHRVTTGILPWPSMKVAKILFFKKNTQIVFHF